jgi:hydrogenase-4 component B
MPALAGLWCVAALFAVGISGLVFGRSRVATTLVYGASLAATLVALTLALTFLLTNGQASSVTLPLGLPWIGAHFRLDPLAAFFLIVVNLGGAIASLYALGYGRHETSPLRVLPYYPVFLGAMNLVVLADDAFVFLLSWEFMSLVSWAMVVAHHRVPANVRAGYIYLVMASFGTLCLLLAFGVLAGTAGEYSFAAMRAAPLTPALALIAGTLTLIGAGSKAGIVPLHVWLPLAHPAAPSHVSALLSGVMTKVGVYGFIRIVFDLIGEPTPYSGLIVAGIGGITAALGVLYALMQHASNGCSLITPSRTSASSSSGLVWRSRSAPTTSVGRRRWRSPPRCFTCSTTRCSRACCSSGQARSWSRPASATWSAWEA